jgi:hypothetical protein
MFFVYCVETCKEFAPLILVTKELAVASQQPTVSHILFTREFWSKNKLSYPTNLPAWLGPLWLFLFPQLWVPPLGHNWGRILGSADHPHRTRLPGCTLKMAEMLQIVHTRERELLRVWWWPVGAKLLFDQTAAPVLESVDSSGIIYANNKSIQLNTCKVFK